MAALIASSTWTMLVPTAPLLAKPSRSVVLLDFSRPATEPFLVAPDSAPVPLQELDEISRAMAIQFTGAPLESPITTSIPRPTFQRPIRTGGAAVLGNPFTLNSLPFRSVLSVSPVASVGECGVPAYRPSFAFGRAAEERRRILFPLVHRAACDAGLPVGLFDAMIMQESRYQPAIISPKGAFGLAQLMPGTAVQLGVDRYSLLENLRGGARYLKQHVNKFGRYDLALAAYNAGPGRVERRWQVPQITETQDYVRTIMANWTGVVPISEMRIRTMPFRQAQMIFMPARIRGL